MKRFIAVISFVLLTLLIGCSNDDSKDNLKKSVSLINLSAQFVNGNELNVGSSPENRLQLIYPIKLDSEESDGVDYFQEWEVIEQIRKAVAENLINLDVTIANRLHPQGMNATFYSDTLVIGYATAWTVHSTGDTILYYEWYPPDRPEETE